MEKMLFLDACISTHASRTKKLCTAYIDEFRRKNPETALETVVLRKGKAEPLTKGTNRGKRRIYPEKGLGSADVRLCQTV